MRRITAVLFVCVGAGLLATTLGQADPPLLTTSGPHPVDVQGPTDFFRVEHDVTAVTWSNDDGMIAAASDYGAIVTIFDLKKNILCKIYRGGKGPFVTNSLALISNGTYLVTAPDYEAPSKTAVTIWDTSTCRKIKDIPGPRPEQDYPFNRADMFEASPNGKILAVQPALNNGVALYDTKSWQLLGLVDVGAEAVSDMAFDPTSSRLAVATLNENVFVSDLTGSSPPVRFHAPEAGSTHTTLGPLAFSPDGHRLVITTGIPVTTSPHAAAVQVFDAESGAHIRTIPGAVPPIRSVAWLSVANSIVVLDAANILRVWPDAGAAGRGSVRMFGSYAGPLTMDRSATGFAYGADRMIGLYRLNETSVTTAK